jgi:hypothetical protein
MMRSDEGFRKADAFGFIHGGTQRVERMVHVFFVPEQDFVVRSVAEVF